MDNFGKFAIWMTTFLSLLGCNTVVNLTLTNSENYPLGVQVKTKDDLGLKADEIEVGTLGPKETRTVESFKVKNGGQFEVSAMIPDSGVIFQEPPRTVSGKIDPLNVSLIISQQRGRRLDNSRALTMISDAFKKLGPDTGVYPLRLQDALRTRFGALLVLPGGDHPDRILFSVTPDQLGVKVIKLEDIGWPSTEESNFTEINGSTSEQAKASVPLYGNFGFTFDASKVYSVNWILQGFGSIPKAEEVGRHISQRFNKLPGEIKRELMKSLKDNAGSKLIYVNNLYVVKKAQLTVKEGSKVVAGGNVDAGSVVTASGAYTFTSNQGSTKEYDEFVLNYWGDVIVPRESAGILENRTSLEPTGEKISIPSYFSDLPRLDAREKR